MNARKLAFLLLLLSTTPSAMAAFCTDEAPNNPCFRANNPVQACTSQLAQNPGSISTRIALCEALAADGRLDEAEVLIGQGISRCRGRSCQRLKIASSYLEEKRAARDRADPREAERKKLADRRFCLTPFNNERSVSACEKLLLSEPEDQEIYAALIQKLLKMGEASGALAYAIKGRSAIGDSKLFADLVEEATRQRKAVVDDCLNDTSLPKCEQAYLAGSPDEYLILRRQGELLTLAGRYAPAYEALRSADTLRSGDSAIRKALAALTAAQSPPPVQTETPSTVSTQDKPADATVARTKTGTEPRQQPKPEPVKKAEETANQKEPEQKDQEKVAQSKPAQNLLPERRQPEQTRSQAEPKQTLAQPDLAQAKPTPRSVSSQTQPNEPIAQQPDVPISYRNRISDAGTSL